ncbi:MAG: acyl carrier protein [Bacillota bacterium]
MDELQKVTKILSQQINLEEFLIKPQTKFDDLGMDSLVVLEFIIAVEEEFDIAIDDSEISRLNNVGEVAELVAAKLK